MMDSLKQDESIDVERASGRCAQCHSTSEDVIVKEADRYISEATLPFIYPCAEDGCSFTAETYGILQGHVKMNHVVDNTYECEICGFETERRKLFNKHNKLVHNITKKFKPKKIVHIHKNIF